VIARPGFLRDEHLPPALAAALRRGDPTMAVEVVGRGRAPPLGTPDPALLRWIEEHGCLLVTNNRASLPRHLADHLASGRHVPGILVVPRRLLGWRPLIDDLALIWRAAAPGEFQDRIEHLPL
jgi:hypothetical protein